ncbi:MAG: stage II sporulation protein M [Thermoleophilia bacterium]
MKSPIRSYLRESLQTIYELRIFILVISLLGLLAVFVGVRFEIISPMPGADSAALNPLPDIAKSNGPSEQVLFGMAKKLAIVGGLLGTSLLHFGIASVGYFYIYCLALGGNSGWFAKYPGTTFWQGFAAFGSSAIFELAALTIAASFSLWIGFALILPGSGNLRRTMVITRFRKILYIAPAILLLIVLSVITELSLAEPLKKSYAQQAVASESKKEVKDPNGRWSLEIPVTWERTYYEKEAENKKTYVVQSKNMPVILEVRAVDTGGTYSREEINSAYSNVVIEQIGTLGLDWQSGPKETSIGNYSWQYFSFTGEDKAINSDDEFAQFYMLPYADRNSNTTNIYSIFVRTPPEWHEFSQPLVDDVISSFHISEL